MNSSECESLDNISGQIGHRKLDEAEVKYTSAPFVYFLIQQVSTMSGSRLAAPAVSAVLHLLA